MKNSLNAKEEELVKELMAECKNTRDVQEMLKRLFAGTIERMLEAEMEEFPGYEKHSAAGNNTGNSRNGYNRKTIISDYGECEIAVPRDRNGEFEPKVIEKRQTRTDEIEQKIQAMYAKGMSQRDIEDTIREIYGAEISQGMISRITDRILPEVNEWQNRPLEKMYPVVYFDGIMFHSRKDNRVINKCVYSVLGINLEGRKEIPGTWISENESASFYASICADLKKIYGAINLDEAERAREGFREVWDRKYPNILKSWDRNWAELTAFFAWPAEIRRIIYTANAVESYHRVVRKFTKTKAIFPTDDSIRKSIYLSAVQIARKWTMPVRDWSLAYQQFLIFFEDRFAA